MNYEPREVPKRYVAATYQGVEIYGAQGYGYWTALTAGWKSFASVGAAKQFIRRRVKRGAPVLPEQVK